MLSFCCYDFCAMRGRMTVETRLPMPVFREKGFAYFTYVPEPKVSPFLNTNSNLMAGAEIYAGTRQLSATALQMVRDSGRGSFFQTGNFLWFSMPDNSDANVPGTDIHVRSQLKLKPWVRFAGYGSLTAILIALFAQPFLATLMQSFSSRHPGLIKLITRVADPVSQFLTSERWAIAAITLLLAIRISMLPPIFNFLDTFTMLRVPLSIVGHTPPLYLLLIAGIKSIFGLGHACLDALLCIQYSVFAIALLYMCTAFNTVKQKLFAIAAVAANFYVLLIVGGVMTESLALPEQMIMFGATLRLINSARTSTRVRDCIIFALSCCLCVITRHTFVIFASAICLYTLLQVVFRRADRSSWKQCLTAVALCCIGALSGYLLSSAAYKTLVPGGSMPTGRFGVQLMARGWQSLPPNERKSIYARLAACSSDPLVQETFKVLLELPNSTQPVYDYATIYARIQQQTRKDYPAYAQRVNSLQELEGATTAATKIFLSHPDKFFVDKVLQFFIDYTQLQLAVTANPIYELTVMKSKDFVDVLGNGWNYPEVHFGYLNRCILDHSAISNMWSHLCTNTTRITDQVFSPENRNLLRDSVNSRLFWLLDFINPASNLILLLFGIIFGTLTKRMSLTGAMFGTAVFVSALAFDALHAVSCQDTLSRYLAPASLQLALGCIVVYSEILFGFRCSTNEQSTGNAQNYATAPLTQDHATELVCK